MKKSQKVELEPVLENKQELFYQAFDEENKKRFKLMLESYKTFYRETYGEEAASDDVLEHGLSFKTRDDLLAFCQEQAKTRCFYGAVYCDGKPTGFHVLSVGDGVLYSGTPAEIHNNLSKALKTTTDEKMILEMRRSLDVIKSFMDKEQLTKQQDFKQQIPRENVETPAPKIPSHKMS
jgi:hypothetical protein